jgi:murein tripeptide amidase MpaA
MRFNRFFTNEELFEIILNWKSEYSKLLHVKKLGESHSGNPIWLLAITNQSTGNADQKPAVWLDANIHATEIAGTTTTLKIAYELLTRWGNDETITQMLNHGTYYIVPRLNPDGAALAMSEQPRFIRSGTRPYPWTEKEDGLHSQDIDGDGRVLQMRIKDPNGDWKISSLDSRLLQKRSPLDNGGIYYRLLPEGLVENWDCYNIKIANPVEGLDFNRNFPFEWRTESDQKGAGPYPTSEPEVKALVDFVTTHLNINLAISYHTFSGVILRPYGTKPDEEMETNDLWVYKQLGQIGTELSGYRCVSTYHDFKYHPKEIITGVFDDWFYDHLGVFSFTVEQWDLPTEAGIKERKFIEWFRDHPHNEDLMILDWIDKNVGTDGYVDWYPFNHPQLGEVELGGWNTMYTWRNPPPAFMEKEAERNARFALSLGQLLPRIEIFEIKVNELGNGNYHLGLVVENKGFLPTYTSKQGKNKKSVRPVRSEIELTDQAVVINGKTRIELGHLEGRSNKLGVTALWETSPTDQRASTEWVVQAAPGAKILIRVLSERAGQLEKEVIIG